MYNNIYENRKVLVTGHTGFKGSWLSLWLKLLGAKVYGYALSPNTNPSMFRILNLEEKLDGSIIGDILDEAQLNSTLGEIKPEIIFHLAAQPLVLLSYEQPTMTYKTNVIGTLNILEAARKTPSVKAVVNVTTDKCYENKNTIHAYSEDDAMGGYDMYSSSKGCAELLSASYRRSFLQNEGSYALATARAGNVIGGGDWARDRILPDCIRAVMNDTSIEIRNPSSIRPWQYVLEPIHGYLLLGQKLLESGDKYAQSFNFGPDNSDTHTVTEIADEVVRVFGKGKVNIINRSTHYEAGLLTLNIDKAKKVLNWVPTYDAKTAIHETVEWYRHFYDNDTDMYEFTIEQIKKFEENIK